MTKKINIFISFFVIIEIVIILFIISTIYFNINNEVIDVFFVNRKYYTYNESSTYKYFYQLKPLKKINDLIPVPDWLSHKPTYTINRDGLNERFDYPIKKSKNVFRIVTIGDSFTFGLFVDTKTNYPEQLEDMLNIKLHCEKFGKFEVINLGVNGYDLPYAIERYKLKGEKYKPDLIVWILKDEDFQWINEGIIPKLQNHELPLKGSTFPSQDSSEWRTIWNKARNEYNTEYSNSKIRDTIQLSLNSMNKFSTNILFLGIPKYTDNKTYKSLLSAFISTNKQSYSFYQLPDIIKSNGVFPESHPNKKGYTILAQSIFEYLIRNDLKSCNHLTYD